MPIYRQIVRHVQEDIAQGRLQAGDKLPSHRELAAELVIAPLTVKRAYDELEGQGLIATERGRGTFVTGRLPGGDPEEGMKRVRHLAERLLSEARIANIEYETVVRVLDDVKKGGGA
ncbi:MAG: GntR family transcriptional regulator [Gemmatimonadetes bacterium]|jgi:GntR family transcriptional regulator|nr:GntR family transcriptional regulator [Gemmatimonadota bacterium]